MTQGEVLLMFVVTAALIAGGLSLATFSTLAQLRKERESGAPSPKEFSRERMR